MKLFCPYWIMHLPLATCLCFHSYSLFSPFCVESYPFFSLLTLAHIRLLFFLVKTVVVWIWDSSICRIGIIFKWVLHRAFHTPEEETCRQTDKRVLVFNSVLWTWRHTWGERDKRSWQNLHGRSPCWYWTVARKESTFDCPQVWNSLELRQCTSLICDLRERKDKHVMKRDWKLMELVRTWGR